MSTSLIRSVFFVGRVNKYSDGTFEAAFDRSGKGVTHYEVARELAKIPRAVLEAASQYYETKDIS